MQSLDRVRFGQFVFNRNTRELLRDGIRISLQQQPLQLLDLLIEHAGEVVTREQIRQALWPDDTHVQFDSSVANAIRKIRIALQDDADRALYIETLPRQGFRFIAPLAPYLGEAKPPQPPTWLKQHYPFLLLATFSVAIAVGAWFYLRPTPPSIAGARPIVALGGRPTHPSLSPNGEMLAFEWEGPDDDAPAIYLQQLESNAPQRLTSGRTIDFWPVWSPDGKSVAFYREVTPTKAEVHLVPVPGNGDRVLFAVSKGPGERPRLNWSPNGKYLVTAERRVTAGGKRQPSYILLFNIETGERRALTRPEADWRGDSEPAFAPDSDTVAFRRTRPTSGDEDIYAVKVSGGEPVALTSDRSPIAALAYTPDQGLLFSSRRGVWLRNFWWLPPRGGDPVRISDPAFDLGSPTISRDGRHIAYVKVLHDENIWSLRPNQSAPYPVSPSEFIESNPAVAGDGQRLAFVSSRTGTLELWTSNLDGSNPQQLTDVRGTVVATPAWSPDMTQIVFEWRKKGKEGLYLIPSHGGAPSPLYLSDKSSGLPRFSHDGHYVYFNSTLSGRLESWRIPLSGGEPEQVTRNGACGAIESSNGKALYYARPDARGLFVNEAGREQLLIPNLDPRDCGNWTVARDTIYYIERGSENVFRGAVMSYHIPSRTSKLLFSLKGFPLLNTTGLAATPDGGTVLFVTVDREGTSIYGR
jgi:Tol biopolymer transport system component/DNA-binding winged helix-turn-helix (wHTH) protein